MPSGQTTTRRFDHRRERSLTRIETGGRFDRSPSPPCRSIRATNGLKTRSIGSFTSGLRTSRLQPAPRADETVLVRRLYFDLIGLPPTPEQIDAYFNNDPASRWEELVDTLLADPAYGEHWARHWLDVVRYAESDGWNQDAFRPHIWRYRDYVVRSFNLDRSYPEFVRQQLAGDEMPGDDPENLAATGFLRLGIYEYNQRDAKSHWNDIVNETDRCDQ